MIIDTSLFSNFLAQNMQVLTYPVKSHPINEENFARWIENHTGHYRDLAIEFRRSTRHVSFSEFKRTLDRVSYDIIQYFYRQQPDNIILFVYPNLLKSNFFIALYVYNFLVSYEVEKPIKIITDTDDFTIVQPNDLVIIPDDASYSGDQFIKFFRSIPPQVQGTCFIAIPYMSSKARERMEELFRKKSLKVIFSENTQIFEPFLGDERNLYTIYFDHKLGDFISTYTRVYADGAEVDAINDPEFLFKPRSGSLITGCDKRLVDCFAPFYKEYEYKYNGELVGNILEVVDLHKHAPPPIYTPFPVLSSFQPFEPSSFQPLPASYFQSLPASSFQPLPASSFQPLPVSSFQPLPVSSFQPLADSSFPSLSSFSHTGTRSRSKRRSKNRSKRRSKNRSQRRSKRYFV